MNVYFVNNTSDNPNWGCRATTAMMLKMIASAGATVTGNLYLAKMQSPQRSRRQRRFLRRLLTVGSERPPRDDEAPASAADFDRSSKKVLDGEILQTESAAIRRADYVVVNGEGSIYDRQRMGRMMFFIAYLAKHHFGKPCAIVNHTADIHDPIMREMAELVYPELDDIVFREQISMQACRGIAPAAEVAPDAAFLWEPLDHDSWQATRNRPDYYSVWPDSAANFDLTKPYICVAGSSIYLRKDRPKYDPVPAFRRLCGELSKLAQVVITIPCRQDERFLRPLARDLGLPAIGLHSPIPQVVDILGNAAVLVSGRWHPSILALCGGTPILTLTANTFKTQALMDMIGSETASYDALQLHSHVDAIVSQAAELIARGPNLRNELRSIARKFAEGAWRNVDCLRPPSDHLCESVLEQSA